MKKLQPITHLRISRAIWLRGEGERKSFLRRGTDGKMCCFGIYLQACGLQNRTLQNVGAPEAIYYDIPAEARWLLDSSSDGRLNSTTAADSRATVYGNGREITRGLLVMEG